MDFYISDGYLPRRAVDELRVYQSSILVSCACVFLKSMTSDSNEHVRLRINDLSCEAYS